MRKIKFRAWDTASKLWLNEFEYNVRFDGMGVQRNGVTGLIGGVELSQFTGHLDKNGVEIWEGDICKQAHPTDESQNLWVVGWSYGSFYFENKINSMKNAGIAGGIEVEDFEVIGNVRENKELLKNG